MAKAKLVGWSGLEPPTSRLSGVCSNLLSYQPKKNGGDERVRTDGLLLARQALSQLSYTPANHERSHRTCVLVGTLKTIQVRFRFSSGLPLPVLRSSALSFPSNEYRPERLLGKRLLSFRFLRLPRKEVIQPHLPIRLPCYDFTPVI